MKKQTSADGYKMGPLNRKTAAYNDVLYPGDHWFREAVRVAGQHGRVADVRCGVDVRLPGTYGWEN